MRPLGNTSKLRSLIFTFLSQSPKVTFATTSWVTECSTLMAGYSNENKILM